MQLYPKKTPSSNLAIRAGLLRGFGRATSSKNAEGRHAGADGFHLALHRLDLRKARERIGEGPRALGQGGHALGEFPDEERKARKPSVVPLFSVGIPFWELLFHLLHKGIVTLGFTRSRCCTMVSPST